MVGEILAMINADKSGFTRATEQAGKEYREFSKKVTNDKPKIDADTGPFEKSQERTEKKTRETAKSIDASFSAAWKSVSADLQRIEREAWESGNGMDEAFSSSLASTRAAMQKLRTEAATTGRGLESDLGGALRKLQDEARELGQAGKEAGEELGSGLSEGLSEALGAIGGGGPLGELLGSLTSGKGAMLGAGLALGGALIAGLQARWAELKVGALIAAQTGAAASEAGRLGSLAGDMYAAGFGESIEDAGAAIAAVVGVLIPADAANDAIGRIASKVQTLGTVLGEEFGAISRSARTLLLNGMASSVGQALDMIAQANEQGLNIAGDLLDTIDEYSGQFARIGIEGPEAFGLLSQAMQGGARDTDFAADAIKEFILRSQDLTVSSRGFQTLGMDAETMSRRIAAGGETARAALREVLNGLQQMPAGLERNTAAVDLFGTKAEDLGDALFSMDLDDAADQFGDFAGSVEEAAQKLEAGMSAAEKFDRTMSNVKSNVGGFLEAITGSDDLDAMTQQVNELQLATDRFMSTGDTSWLDDLKEKYPELAEGIDRWIAANRGAVDAQNAVTGASDSTSGSYEKQARTLEDLIDLEQTRAGAVVSLSEAQIGYQESIVAANAALEKNGPNLDLATAAGRENQGSLNDLSKSTWDVIASMEAQNATTQDVQNYMVGARGEFVAMADALGLDATQANALADKLGLIPGNYQASVEVLAAEQAAARVQNVLDKISALPPEKVVNLRINITGGGANQVIGGHMLAGYAGGGNMPAHPKRRAIGGGVDPQFPYLVGEEGPELIWPDRAGYVSTAAQTSALARQMDKAMQFSSTMLPAQVRGRALGASSRSAAGDGSGRSSSGSGSSYVDRSITMHAVPTVPTMQQLRDLQHEQEALHGWS